MALNFTPHVKAFSTRPVKITLKHVLVMILLTPTAFVWSAFDEATRKNGLEVDNTTSLDVLIEAVPEAAKNIGLTRERIEARVNQSLRKAGITPVSAQSKMNENYLYVSVNTSA